MTGKRYDGKGVELNTVYISEEAPGHFWLKVNHIQLSSNGETQMIIPRTLLNISKHEVERYQKLGFLAASKNL